MTENTAAWGIDELDGSTHTLVANRIGHWEVMIGGGPELFVLTATADGGGRIANALTAVEPDDDDEETVDLTVGGQAVDYPREYALTRDEVAAAIADLDADRFPEARWELVG